VVSPHTSRRSGARDALVGIWVNVDHPYDLAACVVVFRQFRLVFRKSGGVTTDTAVFMDLDTLPGWKRIHP
jgi:hypothetical protein